MVDLLVLTPYPAGQNYTGIFVRNQLFKINAYPNVRVRVIARTPHVPRILAHRKKYQDYLGIPLFYKDDTLDVYRVPYFMPFPTRWGWWYLNGLQLYFRSRGLLKRLIEESDHSSVVLHSHWLNTCGVAGALLSREFGIPHVTTLHHGGDADFSTHMPGQRLLMKSVLSSASKGIAVNEPLKKMVMNLTCRNDIELMPMGVDVEYFSTLDNDEMRIVRDMRHNRSVNRAFNILFVGKIHRDKGVYELVDAVVNLLRKGANIRLTLIGSKVEAHLLESRVAKEGLAKYFEFTGVLPQNKLKLYYHASDMFILPSYSEGFPCSMLEAMACRLPVAVTPVGGVPQLLKHGQNGLLFNCKSVNSIQKAIEEVMCNPDRAKALANQAFKDIQNNYSMAADAAKLVDIYRKLVAQGRAKTK